MLLTGIKQACTRQSNKLAKSQCHNYWNGLFVESKTNSTYSTSAGSSGIILYSTNSANMAFRCERHSIAALLVLSTKHRAGTIVGGLAVGISIEGALGESVQRRFSAARNGRIFRFQHTSMKQKLCSKKWSSGDITWNFQYAFANIDGCKLRRYVNISTRPRYISACSAHMGSLHSLARTCLSHLSNYLTACRHIAELIWFWDHQSIKNLTQNKSLKKLKLSRLKCHSLPPSIPSAQRCKPLGMTP